MAMNTLQAHEHSHPNGNGFIAAHTDHPVVHALLAGGGMAFNLANTNDIAGPSGGKPRDHGQGHGVV